MRAGFCVYRSMVVWYRRSACRGGRGGDRHMLPGFTQIVHTIIHTINPHPVSHTHPVSCGLDLLECTLQLRRRHAMPVTRGDLPQLLFC